MTNLINTGETYASKIEANASAPPTPKIKIEYLRNCGKIGLFADFINCCRTIFRQNEILAVPTIIKAGTRIKFWGIIETKDKKKPGIPI